MTKFTAEYSDFLTEIIKKTSVLAVMAVILIIGNSFKTVYI